MSGPYQLFGLDESPAVRDGIWVDYGEFAIRIRRAGPGNPAWLAALAQAGAAHDLDGLSEAESLPVMAEIYADAVVTAWRGVTDAKGRELAFSVEAVVRLLCDLPELFADLRAQAERLELFRAQRESEIEGN